MPRYKLTIEYNGAPFAGWQKQEDRVSIQSELERAVAAFCGEHTEVVGAGRTDAGVHASGQVAHVDLPKEYDPYRVMMGINFYLLKNCSPLAGERLRASDSEDRSVGGSPHDSASAAPCFVSSPARGEQYKQMDIAIIHAEPVSDDFHARFSATKRYYRYRILNRRPPPALEAGKVWHVPESLNIDAMDDAAMLLRGTHDFTSFRDTQCQAKSPLKTLDQLDVQRVGEEIHLILSARSFLHHQVRIITGTLKMIGTGQWSKADLQKALDACDRRAAGPTAPPEGLYLTKVEYE